MDLSECIALMRLYESFSGDVEQAILMECIRFDMLEPTALVAA